MNMNLNATCKDILEACSCSSLYFCWPARIDLSLFQEFHMTQWNSPSRAAKNLKFQMLCEKEEALNSFCGNSSTFSGQKDSEKLQGTSQIKSLKLLVFPCNHTRLRWNKKFIIRKKTHWNGHQAVRMVWGLGGGSPIVLRITHSVEVGEQRTELIEPNIPIFSPFISSWLLQLLLSHENSSLCWHREWWWDRGGAAFIPLIWGLLGAHVIQALLPSKLCQSPTGILKKILASPFQTLVEDNLHQEEIYCVSRHPLFPWGCCLQ